MFGTNKTNVVNLFRTPETSSLSSDGKTVVFENKSISIGDVTSETVVEPDIKFNVVGKTKIDGDVKMQQNVQIGNPEAANVDANDKLTINGNTKIDGDVKMKKNVQIGDPNTDTDNVDADDKLTINGNTKIDGHVKMKKNVQIGDPEADTANVDPDDKLTINGNTKINGTMNTTEIVIGSDYRLKTNVETLDDSFVVDHLRPVIYNKYNIKNKEIGFIAHELQVHYPDFVSGDKDNNKMQSVNYNNLIGVLVNEIQMLKKRVILLENNYKE